MARYAGICVPLELAVAPGHSKTEKGPGGEPFMRNRKVLVVAIGGLFSSMIGRKTLKRGVGLGWIKPFVPNVRHRTRTWCWNRCMPSKMSVVKNFDADY